MVDQQVLNNVKAATVALSLVKKGSSEPFAIYGSGFLINCGNYVITAGHVSGAIHDMVNYYKMKKLEVDRAIFMLHVRSDRFDFDTASLEEKDVARFRHSQKPVGFTMSDDIDIAVWRIPEKIDDLPSLHVRTPNVELYEEVAMCGYPRGLQSLNFSTAYIGKRLSPVIQFGRVVSLFPVDNSPVPNGFQTDIVGTAGSSGSAIVDLNGSVVGLALEVLGADVVVNNELYIVKIGLVYGLTTNILKVILNKMVPDYFERNIRDTTFPVDTTTFHRVNFHKI
ncbi:MAG: serine protease [Nitrososphaera sp.]